VISIQVSMASRADASPGCQACNIVSEGLFNESLANHYIYYNGNQTYIKVTVLAVDLRNEKLEWQTSDGKTGWTEARYFYSEQSVNELNKSTMRTGYSATCKIYEAAKQKANAGELSGMEMLFLYPVRNACCDPQAARQYGDGRPPAELCSTLP